MTTVAAPAILPSVRILRMYSEKLLDGIAPERFARLPEGVTINHPAWVYGHIATPIHESGRLLGASELPELPDRWPSIFDRSAPARDDPDGAIYPPMDEITSFFFTSLDAVIQSLEGADDATLGAPNAEFLAETFPTVGSYVNGSLTAHALLHLGQVSAWRRLMGLGPCL